VAVTSQELIVAARIAQWRDEVETTSYFSVLNFSNSSSFSEEDHEEDIPPDGSSRVRFVGSLRAERNHHGRLWWQWRHIHWWNDWWERWGDRWQRRQWWRDRW
jgi:hypothetical protein